MDKKTLSHYGWIVVLILILSVLLAFMTPLGSFIAGGFKSFTGGFFDTNNNALDVIKPGMIAPEDCSHENVVLQGQKAPTCKENGYTGDNVCQGCGTKIETGSPIDKLAHTIATDNAIAATCDKKGKTAGEHCSVCNTVLVAQRDTDALGHDWGDAFVAEEATCVGNGISRVACKRSGCDGKQDTVINAKGHAIVTVNGYAATCTEKGLSNGEKCSVCGYVQKAQAEIPANGHTQIKTSAVAATCETAGKTEGIKCSVCSTVIKEVSTVAKLGHQMGSTTTTLTANCEREGQTKTSCQRLGCNYYTTEKIPALGHNTVEDKAVAPTCTETGLTAGLHCTRCSYKKVQDTVAALGHDKVADKAVEATCTATGLTAGEHCTRCSYKKAQDVVPALGHNTVEDKAVAATCTATGLTAGGHCTRCNYTVKQEIVPALGHSTVVDKAVAATCTKTGLTEGEHCTRCSYKVAQNTVDALGHDVAIDKAVSATCTTTGLTQGEHCTRCSYKKAQNVVDALGHNIVIDNAVAATCTTNGLTAGEHCSRCSYRVAQTTVEKLGHQMGGDVVVTPATCESDGQTKSSCTRNGCTHYTTGVIYSLGHDMITDNAVAPTCTTNGLTIGEHCSRCSYKVAQENVAALGHTIVTDKAVAATCTATGLTQGEHCTRCDYKIAQYPTDKLGHDIIIDKAVAATCTTSGLTAGEHCSRCNHKVEQEVVAEFGHQMGTPVTITAATCLGTGETKTSCTRENCTHYVINEVQALGHDVIIDKAVAPTCTTTGLDVGEHCTRCDYEIKQEVIDALGHNMSEMFEVTPATCESAGQNATKCLRSECGYTSYVDISALGHEYYSIVTKEATCTEMGSITHTCIREDKTYTEEIASLGHNMVYDDAQEATCTEYGVTEGAHCTRCDHQTGYTPIEPLKHEYTTTTIKEATCTQNGEIKYTCTRGDHEYTEVIEGHHIDETGCYLELSGNRMTFTGKQYVSEDFYNWMVFNAIPTEGFPEDYHDNGGYFMYGTWIINTVVVMPEGMTDIYEEIEFTHDFGEGIFTGRTDGKETNMYISGRPCDCGECTTTFAEIEFSVGKRSDYYQWMVTDAKDYHCDTCGVPVLYGTWYRNDYAYSKPATHNVKYSAYVNNNGNWEMKDFSTMIIKEQNTVIPRHGHEVWYENYMAMTSSQLTLQEILDGNIGADLTWDAAQQEIFLGDIPQEVTKEFHNWWFKGLASYGNGYEGANKITYGIKDDPNGYFADGGMTWEELFESNKYDLPENVEFDDEGYLIIKVNGEVFNITLDDEKVMKDDKIQAGRTYWYGESCEHNYTSITTQEATCTENGTITFVCQGCRDSYTQAYDKLGHEYNRTVESEATCTQDGLIKYTCIRGDHEYTEVIKGSHKDEKHCGTKWEVEDRRISFTGKQYTTEEFYAWFTNNAKSVSGTSGNDENGYYLEGTWEFNEELSPITDGIDEWTLLNFTYQGNNKSTIILENADCSNCGGKHVYLDISLSGSNKGLVVMAGPEIKDIDYYCDNCNKPIIYGTFYREGYAFPENTGNTIHKVDYGFYTNPDQDEFVMSNKIQVSLDAGTDENGWYKDSVTSYWNPISKEMEDASYLFNNEAHEDDLTWGGVDQYIFFGDEIQVTTQEFHDWFFAGYWLACPEIPTPDGFVPVEEEEAEFKLNTVYYGVLEDDGSDINHRMIKDYALVFQADGTVWVFEDTICPAVICVKDDQTYTVDGEYITLDSATTLKIVDNETLYHHDAFGVYFGNLYAQETDTSGVKYETVYDEVWGEGEKFVFHSNNTVTFTNRYGNSTVLNVEWSENSKYICDIEGLGWASLALEEDKIYCPSTTSWPTTPEDGDEFYYDALYTGSSGLSFTRSEGGMLFVRVYNEYAEDYEWWAMTFSKDVNDKWLPDSYFEVLGKRSDGSWVDDYGTTYTMIDKETVKLGSLPHALLPTSGTYTLDKTVISYGLQYEKTYKEIDSEYTFVFHDNDTVTVNNGNGTTKTMSVRWDAPLFCYIEGYGSIYIEYNGYGVDYVSYSSELFETVTLKINGVTYQADKNTTWEEWVASPYNTNGYVIENGEIYTSDKKYKVSGKKSTDKITSNETITVTRVSDAGPVLHGGGSN